MAVITAGGHNRNDDRDGGGYANPYADFRARREIAPARRLSLREGESSSHSGPRVGGHAVYASVRLSSEVIPESGDDGLDLSCCRRSLFYSDLSGCRRAEAQRKNEQRSERG